MLKNTPTSAKQVFYRNLFSILLISSLGFIAYSNSFGAPFVFDDRSSIVNNLAIRNIFNIPSIWNFWPCRFITYFSIAFNYHFSGLHVFGYHLLNLAVHLISAILVWWLVLLTLNTPIIREEKISQHAGILALLAGLIFVAHPIQTQAVTYITQRAASMAAMFYLTSLCFYIKARLLDPPLLCKEGIGEFKHSQRISYICSLISAILAMFCKESAMTLPLMILLYEYCFFRIKANSNPTFLLPILLTFFVIPVTALFTQSINFHDWHRAAEDPAGISPVHYLLTQFRVVGTYFRLVFLPVNQNLDYDYAVSTSIFDFRVLFSFIFLIFIFIAAKRLFLKYRLISFSIGWFFLALLPESSIFPIKDVINEHRLYLPMAGFSIFLVSSAYYLVGKNSLKLMVIILIFFITTYSVLTYQRNKIWGNELVLWNDVIQKSPLSPRPYNNRGLAFYDRKNYVQAMADFNQAIELDPSYAQAYSNRGLIYDKQNKYTRAIDEYTQTIQLKPHSPQAYTNRAIDYYRLGIYDKARADLQQAETQGAIVNPQLINLFNHAWRGLSHR